jgi:PKHD-type hydroxylase
MLLHIPQLLTTEQVELVCAHLNADDAPWVDGRVTAGHQGAPVKRNQQISETSALAHSLGDLILGTLESNPLFISAALPNRVYPPLFNRYSENMYFGTHVDGAVRMIPVSADKLRTDLSATLFLVPPDTYDGGELIIESNAGNRSIKLAAGDLIVYPATTRHRVTPVTRGVRMASFFWIQSMVRDEIKREQLFDLDNTIQRLTSTGADQEALVHLTSHYHNLLRQWADL